jgi:hypothetical protein
MRACSIQDIAHAWRSVVDKALRVEDELTLTLQKHR